MLPTVVIIGRPNVGKSTLFNRLTGKKHALVEDTPGVTRDWREGEGRIGNLHFRVIDTAGLEEADPGSLTARMRAQTEIAMSRGDVILMLIDARAGITPLDAQFAREVRKLGKKLVLAANKAEGKYAAEIYAEALRLGLGEAVPISAEHGEGLADLFQALLPSLDTGEPEEAPEETVEDEEAPELQLAIIGRPNAGKSTLLNKILGEERVLTGPEAGITRDAIAVECEWGGRKLKLIDTAGMRRKSNISLELEKMAVGDSLRAIKYAHVVILVMDAEFALEKQDNSLAALIEQEGRALVIAINKWDKVANKKQFMKDFDHRLSEVLPQMSGVPVISISAIDGKGLDALFKASFKAYEIWNRKLPTAALNRWLEAALARHSPPLVKGRRIKIRYMTQVRTRPPTFQLFANLSDIPESYVRYLGHGMREYFDLPGVPLRFKIRKGENPFEDKKKKR